MRKPTLNTLFPIIFLFFCISSFLGASPLDKNTVIVAMTTDSEPKGGFDPILGWGSGEHVHEPLIQSTLTITTKDLQIAYDLAKNIEVSKDGLTWTVTIRDDVFFTDGQQLTAEDVAFTYNKVKELSPVNDFTMLKSAKALNKNTVIFQMNRPYSAWPYDMANVGIVPKHAYDKNYGENPIGSGRYMLAQWDKGQQVILKANPNYSGPKPIIKKVVILFMNEDAAYGATKAGKVDVAYTTPSYAQEKIQGYDILSVTTVDNRGINLPTVKKTGEIGNDFTSELAVRKAIDIGIDRNKLIKYILKGYGVPAYSVADKMPWYTDANIVQYNPQEAKNILKNAGWILNKNGIREKNSIEAKLNILYPVGDSVREGLAAEVSQELKELGINATFEGVGWDTGYVRAQSEPIIWGWGSHTPMEVYNLYHTAINGKYAAYSPYSNKKADLLMDKALETNNLQESFTLWQKSQETIAKDVPWVWLVNINHIYWVRDGLNVAKQKIHPHGHGWSIVNNVDQWNWSK